MTAGLFGALKCQVPDNVITDLSALMSSVESELAEQTRSVVATVESVGSVTLQAGGKRLRPALVVVSALATGRPVDPSRLVKLGSSLEMVHMATLVHDDVIDEADTRRGHPTAASLHGNTAAILSGDVLLARAMRLLAMDGDLGIIRAVSGAVVDLAEGEVRELECRGHFDLGEAEHRDVLEKKTASLIACACRVGAMVAGSSTAEEDALTRYGHHLGMAFQIVDDLLDYRGDHTKTGKPRATDFRDGQATLPLIYLRERLDSTEAVATESRFGNGVTDTELEEIARWMDERGAFRTAEEAADREARLALDSLSSVPPSHYRSLLQSVATFVVGREA